MVSYGVGRFLSLLNGHLKKSACIQVIGLIVFALAYLLQLPRREFKMPMKQYAISIHGHGKYIQVFPVKVLPAPK